jgi:hypothetical protein
MSRIPLFQGLPSLGGDVCYEIVCSGGSTARKFLLCGKSSV